MEWSEYKSTLPLALKGKNAEFDKMISIPFLFDRNQSIRVESILSNIELNQAEILSTEEIYLSKFFGKNGPFSETFFEKGSSRHTTSLSLI